MNSASFYFYDLETSGTNPRGARIMQFAGQRTDLHLKPIGEPDNLMIKLTEDILPDPEAILITGITPQATRADGITEAEFLKYFSNEICQPNTIFVGYNNIRFDDEFMRHTLYRNFYDAYEWAWKEGRGRWDLLDVIRLTRALRPEGIKWPVETSGKPSNKLELLTGVNGLSHKNAHDALADVKALISLATLLRNKQTKLFDFMLAMRDKKKVEELVISGQPFVYASGKYPSAYEKTTVVVSLGKHPDRQGVLVYDLRRDPEFLNKMTAEEIAEKWQTYEEDETKRFPIKTMQFNRCPAVAPMSVLDAKSANRIKLDLEIIKSHQKKLAQISGLREILLEALEIMDKRRQTTLYADEQDVDAKLYDGFIGDADKNAMAVIRNAETEDINSISMEFKDDRLNKLLPLYKARNFPQSLSNEDRTQWDKFRYHKLVDGGQNSLLTKYFKRLAELSERKNLTSKQKYLLEELSLWGEQLMPEPESYDE